MGYKVIYTDDKKAERRSRAIPLTFLFFAMFMGWVFRYWEQGREVVMELLLPMSGSAAEEVIEAMMYQLRSGESILNVAEDFFASIFKGSIEGPY